MDRSILLTAVIIAVLIAPAIVSAVEDPSVERMYSSPSNPIIYEDFEIHVFAQDDDGIGDVELYVDGDLEDTESCEGDDNCHVSFDTYQTEIGTYTYKVKVYDLDENTDTDTLRVYVKSESEGVPDVSAYASPPAPQTGQPFSIYTTATDDDGLRRIEIIHGGSIVGSHDCGVMAACSRKFSIAPKSTPGTYTFQIKAYDTADDIGTTSISVVVASPSPYCGDETCNSGETCTSCPQDCGACPVSYCGDAVCSSGETCSSCQQDCGACPILPVVYTCEQRGGKCCAYGGTSIIDGGADCPSKCFTKCNPAPVTPAPTTPTGGVITVDTPVIILALLVVMILLLFFIVAKL